METLHKLSEKEFIEHAYQVSKFIHDSDRDVDFFVKQKASVDALVAEAVVEGN